VSLIYYFVNISFVQSRWKKWNYCFMFITNILNTYCKFVTNHNLHLVLVRMKSLILQLISWKSLVKPIENSKRNLTTDNWYASVPLVDYLLQKKKKLLLLELWEKNKKEIPKVFLRDKKKKEFGSYIFGFQKNKSLVTYVPRKNNAVLLLSILCTMVVKLT